MKGKENFYYLKKKSLEILIPNHCDYSINVGLCRLLFHYKRIKERPFFYTYCNLVGLFLAHHCTTVYLVNARIYHHSLVESILYLHTPPPSYVCLYVHCTTLYLFFGLPVTQTVKTYFKIIKNFQYSILFL